MAASGSARRREIRVVGSSVIVAPAVKVAVMAFMLFSISGAQARAFEVVEDRALDDVGGEGAVRHRDVRVWPSRSRPSTTTAIAIDRPSASLQ